MFYFTSSSQLTLHFFLLFTSFAAFINQACKKTQVWHEKEHKKSFTLIDSYRCFVHTSYLFLVYFLFSLISFSFFLSFQHLFHGDTWCTERFMICAQYIHVRYIFTTAFPPTVDQMLVNCKLWLFASLHFMNLFWSGRIAAELKQLVRQSETICRSDRLIPCPVYPPAALSFGSPCAPEVRSG